MSETPPNQPPAKPAEEPTKDAAAPAADPAAEITLEEIDALIEAEDPSFRLNALEIASVQVGSEVVIDNETLEEVQIDENSKATREDLLTPQEKFLKRHLTRLRRALNYWIKQPMYWWAEFRQGAWPFVKKHGIGFIKSTVAKSLAAVKNAMATTSTSLRKTVDFIKYSRAREKSLIFLAFCLLMAVGAVAWYALTGRSINFMQSPYLRSYGDVAEKVWDYDINGPTQDFYGSSLQPQFFVQLDKLIVNLKPVGESKTPMGVFQFYIEGSSQETAVEIKDREKELRNIIQLTLHEMTYDQLSSPEGLANAKKAIANEVNKFLTQGRARRVLLDTVVLKP